MPSTTQLPSSFASAVAAGASGAAGVAGRGVSMRGVDTTRGSGDWPRQDNRGTNGTLLTLRRSSTNPLGSFQQRLSEARSEATASTPNSEIPPSQSQQNSSTQNEGHGDQRYTKSLILEIYRAQQSSDNAYGDVSRLFVSDFDPGHSNGTNGRGWGKANDSNNNSHGPEVCWNEGGTTAPISLEEMTEEEKIIFAGDVNSTMKPPMQNATKDQNSQHSGLNGRKASVSHRDVSSPTNSRPGTRRRENAESGSLASPSGNSRFPRDENGPISPFFNRKINENADDRAEDAERKMSNPFGGLMRSNTGGSAFSNGLSTPRGAAAPGTSAMGAFGSFALPQATTIGADRRAAFSRGESRFANLMSKDASEEKSSDAQKSWRNTRSRTDTDPYAGDDSGPIGSAALAGDDPNPPVFLHGSGADTPPTRQVSSDLGFSNMSSFHELLQRRANQPQQTPQGHQDRESEPLSPTETNPFRSPPSNERDNYDPFDGESQNNSRLQGLGGIPEPPSNQFHSLPRGFGSNTFEGSDRSQTSSVSGVKPFPPLGGLGGLGSLCGLGAGWPTTSAMGTPDRERPGFPSFTNSIFGSTSEMQSPSLGVAQTYGTASRGSKLGTLFPAAMQAQMQGSENDQGDHSEQRQGNAFGTIGKNAFGLPPRDTDSPMRTGRNAFEDLFLNSNARDQPSPFNSSDVYQAFTSAAPQAFTSAAPQASTAAPQASTAAPQASTAAPQASTAAPQASIAAPTTQTLSHLSMNLSNYRQAQASSDTPQLLQHQEPTIIMPDRMRWLYLDPQGNEQGPWSGLEMHDWYKANFFDASLQIKKVEDPEFYPLAHLIRRVGNAREPFLIPQAGISHPAIPGQASAFTQPAVNTGMGGQPGAVQPPFAGAFPSFGTTLTAEQQNALERRKQEEQFLMARQRELLTAHQMNQINIKQLQMQGLPAPLHHHSSAHSLHSQPSFPSMNVSSPMSMPPTGQLGSTNIAGFFDQAQRNAAAQAAPADFFRDDEVARLSMAARQQLLSVAGANQKDPRQSIIAQMMALKQEQEREQSRMDQVRPADPQLFSDRLREFEQLRSHEPQEQINQTLANNPIGPPQQHQQHQQNQTQQRQESTSYQVEHRQSEQKQEEPIEELRSLTLTEQVQKAASAKQSPQPATQADSPWGKVQSGLPMPFPPPQSTTPLPAPTAQRDRSNIPEALNFESRDRSLTPEARTPSLAPWAKEPTEAPKGPSLKEIQEIEAKKAAKQEELAAAARRAQLEQEIRNAQSVAAAPALGLPTSSTWGATASPNSLSAGANSVWAKPAATKAHAQNASSNKKTLADIQREEEARKNKSAANAAAAAISSSSSGLSGGKRYADLASKPMASPSTGGAAWSTVGAGGKVKVPASPAVAPVQRAVTTPAIAKPAKTTPTTTRAGNPVPGKQDITKATEEFLKWSKAALGKGLNADIDVDSFVDTLIALPAENSIISETVYQSSLVLDGRRFADEFIRRRKLAEKGIVESASNGASGGFMTAGAGSETKSGGWSEVAKKNPPKVEPEIIGGSGFKFVPSKKKGKK